MFLRKFYFSRLWAFHRDVTETFSRREKRVKMRMAKQKTGTRGDRLRSLKIAVQPTSRTKSLQFMLRSKGLEKPEMRGQRLKRQLHDLARPAEIQQLPGAVLLARRSQTFCGGSGMTACDKNTRKIDVTRRRPSGHGMQMPPGAPRPGDRRGRRDRDSRRKRNRSTSFAATQAVGASLAALAQPGDPWPRALLRRRRFSPLS